MRTAAISVIAIVALAGTAWWASAQTAPGPVIAPREGPLVDHGTRKKKRAGNKLDNTPADPPARTVQLLPPTTNAGPFPDVSEVARPESKPNVVVILGCTVRKDQLTPYGAPDDATPFLAELAAEGVLFDDLIAAAPWTRAASTAILTGHHAVSIGMVEPKKGRNDHRLPEAITTMAEHFSGAGYFTFGGTANPNLSADFGFAQGFDAYQVGMEEGWDHQLDGPRMSANLLSQLDENRSGGDTRPFFLRAMYIDAHSPRLSKEDQYGPYLRDDEPERIGQYRYHLRQLDESMRSLVTGLEDRGFGPDNTLFVFVADHGEGMNYPRSHGFSHGQYLSSSTVYVPWLMRGPGVARGHVVRGVASQVDVLPTVLGAAGLRQPRAADGTDLSDLVRGAGHVTPNGIAWVDTWFGESNRAGIYTHGRQCQLDFGSSERQLEKGKFVDGCYDREADPMFLEPFQDQGLTARLREWRAARTAELALAKTEVFEVDAELGKQLEVLGYHE